VAAVNAPRKVVFRDNINNNMRKQISINTSDDLTILEGNDDGDFADGGTGSKKVVKRSDTISIAVNTRPTTSINQATSAATAGMQNQSRPDNTIGGATGSPNEIMINGFDLQEDHNVTPQPRERNNKRDRAIRHLR
jgi:hypothetical protein